MSRKGRVAKRDVLPDPVYNSKTISKLINNIMLDGKKGVAQNILYDAFKKVPSAGAAAWAAQLEAEAFSCFGRRRIPAMP